MKFEIDKSKLEQVVLEYLKRKNFVIFKTPNNYYFLENRNDDYSKIRVFEVQLAICYIDDDLVGEICDFFSIKPKIAKELIVLYVESKLNVKIGHISWHSSSTVLMV